MKFKKVTAAFESENLTLAEELICDIFFSFRLKGVVCNIPLEEPDEGFGTQTLPPVTDYSIEGYFPDVDASQIVIRDIKKQTQGLAKLGIQVTLEVTEVDEEDWAHAWKEYFNVTRIGKNIVIKPAWKDHDPAPEDLIIELDPGMAFGTGTHPTTFSCLEMLETYTQPGATFMDVGCGSGILTIAAAKLGASPLTALDNDETAVAISEKNLAHNGIDGAHLVTATLDQLPTTPQDLIAANIIAQVLVNIMGDIAHRLAPGGIAILSGIIQERREDIMEALKAQNLKIVEEKNMDEWVTLAITHGEVDG